MKLEFRTKEVMPHLLKVASVVNSKNAIPILDCVMMRVCSDKHTLMLTASDGETWLTMCAPIDSADADGKFCVTASDLTKALKNLPDTGLTTLTLDAEKHIMECRYMNGQFTLPYYDTDEYPKPTAIMDETTTCEVAQSQLYNAIDSVLYAVSNDELRPQMNGVHFDFIDGGGMVTVASNGHVLARHNDMGISHSAKEVQNFTLPTKPASIVKNIVSRSSEDKVCLSWTDKAVRVQSEDFRMTTRLAEGRFPNYNAVIPTSCVTCVEIDKGSIIAALKRVLTMGASNELAALEFGRGKVTISVEDMEFSRSASEDVPCGYDAEENMAIGFNGSLLFQAISSIDTETVHMEVTDASRAAVIYGADRNEYLSLVMPMMLNTPAR